MPTKSEFEAYKKVQMSGKYNMVMNAHEAAAEAGLGIDTYFDVIHNYKALAEKYGA